MCVERNCIVASVRAVDLRSAVPAECLSAKHSHLSCMHAWLFLEKSKVQQTRARGLHAPRDTTPMPDDSRGGSEHAGCASGRRTRGAMPCEAARRLASSRLIAFSLLE